MRKSRKIEPGHSSWDSEVRLLAWLATCASVISFLFYAQRNQVLLYGDAIAHINIARRVFDSKTPGLLQLGTVWLPLPHLLMIPFLISNEMWRRGAGGSIPSMVAYVFGVIGIFRLTRSSLGRGNLPDSPARVAPWIAALIYAANPNLIYMQSTAMGETLYLAFFIWSLVFLTEFVGGEGKALVKCGLCLAAACLTRYDGWFLSAALVAFVLLRFLLSANAVSESQPDPRLRMSVAKFILIAAAAPALWLAYNGIVYRNPLEFENGPYSAKAIERKSQAASNPGHPGGGNPVLAGTYFVKAAEDNMAVNQWLQRAWILLSLLAAAVLIFTRRQQGGAIAQQATPLWCLLFLLLPILFYALSIAYSGIPIFVPNWWPFTHYNVRYGLQLLPAFSVAPALLAYGVLHSDKWNSRARFASMPAILAFSAASYAFVWQATPICLAEAQSNMRSRNQLQMELARWLERLPPDSTLLMYLGDQVGALERAGIPLQRTINEGNHRVWKQPIDPEGLWERALAQPSQYADYVVAFEGDPVWRAVHDLHLTALVELHVTGQPHATLYRAR
jgi:hypothetical protein